MDFATLMSQLQQQGLPPQASAMLQGLGGMSPQMQALVQQQQGQTMPGQFLPSVLPTSNPLSSNIRGRF